MLTIKIERDGNCQSHHHTSGPLVIGRIDSAAEPFLEVADPYFSQRQLQLEECATGLSFTNLGRNPCQLPDGRQFLQNSGAQVTLPTSFRFEQTTIHVDVAGRSKQSIVDTVVIGAVPGWEEMPQVPISQLGREPSLTEMARWFQRLVTVQRSVDGSASFYQETADALVDLIDLDRGMVLLREGNDWKTVAAKAKDGLTPEYSSSIVNEVVRTRETCSQNPHGDLKASLAGVEAVVGAPIFNESQDVVGVLYGSKDVDPLRPGTTIQELEELLVNTLANMVTSGLIRNSYQERLRNSEKLAAVGQALGFILHDLRGPLGNAQQLTEMLRGNQPSTMSREEQLDFVDESLAASLDLINDTLEFCRGNIQLRLVRGDCRSMLARSLRMIDLRLQSYGVAMEIDIPDGIPVVLDPARISRVIYNLAKNAAEALKDQPDGRVRISVRPTLRGFRLQIADNGPGLPEQVKAKMFQPFGTHGKRGGTGFGLAISRQLVDAHLATIDVETGPDGTTFTIEFPDRPNLPQTTTPSTTTPEEPVAQPVSDRPARVLVAEDGKVNQALINILLSELGYVGTVVADGAAAVDAWDQSDFDLILMDLEMPEMDGLEATQAIRTRESSNQHIPIIALTAHSDESVRQHCLGSGMDDYLDKPPTAETLRNMVDKHYPVTKS